MTSDAGPELFGTDADASLFRRAMSRFVTGVGVVTTVHEELDHAMTASSIASVSLDPLMMLVCVEREGRFHDAIAGSGEWAVSILDGSARGVADWFATRGRPIHGQLSQIPHRRGAVTHAPLIEASVAWLECRTSQLVVAGDHSVVIGQVVSCALGPDAAPTLAHYRGRYTHLD